MTERRIDVPTVIAIAAIVNVSATIVHEAAGHGLAAALFGAHIVHVSSVDLLYDERTLTTVQNRIVAAAGPLANLVIGLLVVWLTDRWPPANPAKHYAQWLFGHVNLFVGGGYALALSFAGFGDMQAIVNGLPAPVAWQVLLTLTGLAISMLTLRHAVPALVPFLGEGADRRRRAVVLTFVPYLTMGIVATTAGALNPDDPLLIVLSAGASSFGGNAFIAWIPMWVRRVHAPGEALPVPRRPLYLVVAIALLAFDYAGLAPGLPR